MPSISASAYTPGAKFHKSSFVFPHILWAQPLGMLRSNDWELGVKRHRADVSMSGSLARNLHIMYWLCHCQGEAANPRRINYRSFQFMHLDGWVVWCSWKPKTKLEMLSLHHASHVDDSWVRLIRSSVAPCWWIPDWCSSWQLGDQLQLQLGELLSWGPLTMSN